MHHQLPRADVPGVIMTSEFGRRPSRGIRRRNRRLIAQARRKHGQSNLSKKFWKKQEERPQSPASRPATTPSFEGGSVRSVGWGPPAQTPTSLDPWAYSFEVERKPKGARGDCPQCGQYGEHPLKNFRLSPDGTPIKLRECWDCHAKFSDLPKPEAPPKEPGYEELPDSKDRRYNDCPMCSRTDVSTYVVMRDGRNQEVKACKCPDGHLFKKGREALEPNRLWLDRSQRL